MNVNTRNIAFEEADVLSESCKQLRAAREIDPSTNRLESYTREAEDLDQIQAHSVGRFNLTWKEKRMPTRPLGCTMKLCLRAMTGPVVQHHE